MAAIYSQWLHSEGFIVCSPLAIAKICYQNDPEGELREKQLTLACLTSLIVYQHD